MPYTIYECFPQGVCKQIDPSECDSPLIPSQFCIVYKYEEIYKKEFPRFTDRTDTPYALPGKNKPMRFYNGLDRNPHFITPDDFDAYTVEEVKLFAELAAETENIELIFIRMDGCDDEIPEGLKFLGYDAAYPFGRDSGDGFSTIGDCLFMPRWHGCDNEGTMFIDEFNRLNENGLFDKKEDAYAYMKHYLSWEGCETGVYCVYEIYR